VDEAQLARRLGCVLGERIGIFPERHRERPQQTVADIEHRLVVGGHRIGEASQLRPCVRPEHRVAREIIGVVVGQVQRGVEGLLHLGHPGREALLTRGDVTPMAFGQPDVVAHLLLERQAEELLRRRQHAFEQRVVDARAAHVEEPDFAGRLADLARHPLALRQVLRTQPADVDVRQRRE
jgi:hypothetical protein